MTECWGDELEWCGKHGGYHLRNEDGGIAVVTKIEDAQTLARLLNAAQALAEAAQVVDRADGVTGGSSAMAYPVDRLRVALAAYRAAREGASDD